MISVTTRNEFRRDGLLLVLSLLAASCASLSALGGPLVTRWSLNISSTNVLGEYPRPQLVREAWQNLNGSWDFQVTGDSNRPPKDFTGKILVPFPIESHLSGVGRPLDERSTLWYRRTFTLPPGWRDKQVQIHFGAVDWSAKVIVNDQFVGTHRGGYDAFSFDITRMLNWGSENEIVVGVIDPTEGDQARGKQTRKAEGIFYTSSSGIWQTVWLEPLPQEHIQAAALVPSVEKSAVRATVMANSLAESLRAEVVVSFEGKEMGRASAAPGTEMSVPLRESFLWSPARPALYEVTIVLRRGNEIKDQVRSYFGLREIRVGADASGVLRLFLNGRPMFQMGVLDQGFWPDGLYTAPTDEALRFDLETARQLGFNLVRKHVKVEPERWYYWADKLGLLVWQDMPSGNNATETSRRQFETELTRLVDQKANHPCIIMWVLFNEGWGQFDTERLVRRIKAIDPSRLVNNASGWTDLKVGDVIDLHSYPHPLAPPMQPARAGVLGEFGGLGLGVTNHTWLARQPWGYQILPDAERLTDEYGVLLGKVWDLQKSNGLAAAIYTQLTDVETECNGFLTYDREVLKMDACKVRRANLNPTKLFPDARDGVVSWKYTTNTPPDHWMRPDFDDSGWAAGIAGFGAGNPPQAIIKTPWNTPEIWLRRQVEFKPGSLVPTVLTVYHDEDAKVYLNGVEVVTAPGFVTGYKEFCLPAEVRKAMRAGKNVIAVHCRQTGGGQFIDVGMFAEEAP